MLHSKLHSHHYQSICVKDPAIESNHAHIPPIYATSTFTYEDLEAAFAFFRGESDIYTYSRFGNPSTAFLAQKIAELEVCGISEPIEARGLLFSSGMAAISSALISQLKAGDTVLRQSIIYGAASDLIDNDFKAFDIHSATHNFKDLDHLEKTIKKNPTIKVFYLETPANPTLACVDLNAICDFAQQYGIKVIIDNTFATSYVQQPLKFGVDIVVYSTTKFMNGHGTGISGAVVTRSLDDHKKIYQLLKNLGGVCSPFEAYLLNNGLKTLPLRIRQHQYNAQLLAEYLTTHEKVKKVNFLGLPTHPDHLLASEQMMGTTGMLSFELKGGLEEGMKFQKKIKFCTLTASLGTADTLITHPASTSHAVVDRNERIENGITDGLVRCSVGIEHIDDVLEDFEQALTT
ncbi:MAG TPA: aminotransferase class I/II-fold pyridoxal phosphate-dependent enzyme [Chitinophagales bacterium]|nr:aminotransferase class I/II-fold pyridoxal phosphate-dependent enzyme [Chitinophagales bacterium]